MTRRLRHLLAATVGTAALLVGLAGGLAWRLSQGPLELPGVAALVAERLSEPERGLFVSIDSIVLAYAVNPIDGSGRIEVEALGAMVRDAAGVTLASAPEVGLGLSAAALLQGELRPTRLELVRPRLTIVRQPDGGFGFAIAAAPPQPAAQPTAPESPPDMTPESTAATPVAAGLLQALLQPPDSRPVLGLLRIVAVRDGDLTISDPGRGLHWRAAPANLLLRRGGAGIEGQLRLALDLKENAQRLPLTATLSYDAASGRSLLTTTFDQLTPAALAGLADDLAPLRGVSIPLSGRIEATLGTDFRLAATKFDLRSVGAAGGAVVLPPSLGGGAVAVQAAAATGEFDMATRRLNLSQASLRLDGVAVTASGAADLMAIPLRVEGQAQATLTNFQPGWLAGLTPQLAPLTGAQLPLSGTVEIEQRGDAPRGRLTLTAGNGMLALPDIFPDPLPVRGGRIEAAADAATGVGDLKLTQLDLGGPRLSADIAARLAGDRVETTAALELLDVEIPRLAQYWPPVAAAKAREWTLQNLVAGRAPRLTAHGSASIPLAAPADLTPGKIGARIELENATLHYFRPLPPVVDIVSAVADFDGKDFVIHTQGGTVGLPGLEPVQAHDGRIDIYNVGSPREDLAADVGLTGPLRTILSVVDLPPLGYPSKLDIKPDKTAGHVDGRLKVAFPLLDSVKLDDVAVQATATATGAAIEKVVAGRDATEGEMNVELDTHSMTVAGKARFDSVPITFKWREVFDATIKGPGTLLEAQGRADMKRLATFGPDLLTEYGVGPVEAKVRYASAADHTATLNVNLDLAPTRLAAPVLRWRKAAGEPGQARFVLHFKDGKPTRLTDLRLDGGGLSATATIQLGEGGTQANRIDAPSIKVGDTNMAVSATRGADGVYAVRLTGAALDLRGPLEVETPDEELRPANRPVKIPPPMTVDLQLARVLFGPDRGLTQASGQMIRRDGEWSAITLRGRTPPQGELSIRQEAARAGGVRLTIDADNAGAALRALDVTERVRGGTLKVRGQSATATPKSPLDGEIEMLDYTLVEAPALARILSAMSVTGLVDALGGEGINFGSLTGKFRKEERRLLLKDIRTSGGSLGLTAEGEINLADDTARMNGTVVPFYAVNRIVGQIPLLGDLLSGGPGHGIFAAAWSVEGKLSDPNVTVNPLSILTPGFLRNLFFSGPGDSSDGNSNSNNGKPAGAPPQSQPPDNPHFR